MLIIAHRGASGYESENTLRAFEKALSLGSTWIELDVFPVENELVVTHDPDLSKTTDGQGLIFSKSLAEIRKLRCKNGQGIPLLGEALDLIDKRAAINIELKDAGATATVAKRIKERLTKGWSIEQFLVSSFDHRALKELKSLAPEIRTGALLYGIPHDGASCIKALSAYSLHTHIDFTPAELVAEAHAAGAKVFTYTVNSPDEWKLARAAGVDGVFTDYPDQMF